MAAPEVFLYYDEDYGFNPDGWGDWNSTKKIEDAVAAELDEAKIASVVGDADAFLAYMEENPEGRCCFTNCCSRNRLHDWYER